MIKIAKGDAPAQLVTDSMRIAGVMKAAIVLDQASYFSGEEKFAFTGEYREAATRNALTKYQYNKCCFSEAKFNGDYSHVEHFRPKGRVDDLETNVPEYPGYYWLAYEWENLFLCKSRINVSYKKNYFPLTEGSTRNRTHLDKNVETPVLINPAIENPRNFIVFHNDEIRPVDERGEANIKLLGLRHSEFSEARLTKFNLLKNLRDIVDLLLKQGLPKENSVIVDAIEQLKSAIKPTAEFSSMAIDYLSGWPHLV